MSGIAAAVSLAVVLVGGVDPIAEPAPKRLQHRHAALILDVGAMAKSANLSVAATSTVDSSVQERGHLEPILTVTVGDRQAGLPTSALERLEKVELTEFERTGRSSVVQYRGRLLPLVFLSDFLDGPLQQPDGRPLRVVVTSERAETSVGLVVDQVLDVVEVDPDTTDRVGSEGRLGVIGSIVAAGSVIELLDVPALITTVDTGPVDAATHFTTTDAVGSAA